MRQSSEVLFVGPELPEHFVSELDELFESFRCFGASSFWQKLELGLGHGVSTFKAESIRLFQSWCQECVVWGQGAIILVAYVLMFVA